MAKAKLVKCIAKLAQAAKKKGIAGQQWWPGESATGKTKKKTDVNLIGESGDTLSGDCNVLASRLSRIEGTLVAAIAGLSGSPV